MGAFGVLLLRITQRRFSATQYALFSSLFALPRLVAGPITGFIVHAVGWIPFFWFTMVMGLPGMILLARFVPPGSREPDLETETREPTARPLSTTAVAARAVAAGAIAFLLSVGTLAALAGLEAVREGAELAFRERSLAILMPGDAGAWLEWLGSVTVGIITALLLGAVVAVRHGMTGRPESGGRGGT
jgi:PAT family beta-lactamase induction signal transducer AmpG